jgi:type IV fimbrial biogenesis protein FimT
MRQRGFTLIELVVTITVLGLLVALGMPAMSDWMGSLRIRNAAESAQNGLSKARMEAMRRNQVVTYWIVTDKTAGCALTSAAASWVVSLDDPTGHCADAASTAATPRLIEAYGASDGAGDVVVAATASGGAAATSVSFNGFGQVVNAGTSIAAINLSSNTVASGRRLRVTISPGGAIRMCDPLVVTAGDSRACS